MVIIVGKVDATEATRATVRRVLVSHSGMTTLLFHAVFVRDSSWQMVKIMHTPCYDYSHTHKTT